MAYSEVDFLGGKYDWIHPWILHFKVYCLYELNKQMLFEALVRGSENTVVVGIALQLIPD